MWSWRGHALQVSLDSHSESQPWGSSDVPSISHSSLASAPPMFLRPRPFNHITLHGPITLCGLCPLSICLSDPGLDQGCDPVTLGGTGPHAVREVFRLLHSSCPSGALGRRLRSGSQASSCAFLGDSPSLSLPVTVTLKLSLGFCPLWVCACHSTAAPWWTVRALS